MTPRNAQERLVVLSHAPSTWPSCFPPEHMEVKEREGLSALGTDVRGDAVPVLDAGLGRYLLGGPENSSTAGHGVFRSVRERKRYDPLAPRGGARSPWELVFEHHQILVLIDEVGRLLTGNDPAEQACTVHFLSSSGTDVSYWGHRQINLVARLCDNCLRSVGGT